MVELRDPLDPIQDRTLLRRQTVIHERPGFRPLHVTGFDGIDLEPRSADQVVHLAIEVTASADPFPARRQSMLPTGYSAFLRQPVLDEKQSPARFENPPHLDERRDWIRDRAQGPGYHDRIEDRDAEWEMFCRSSDQRYRDNCMSRSLVRQTQQFRRRIDPADVIYFPTVEAEVQTRPDADLKNQTLRRLDRLLAIMVQRPVSHCEVEQAGQYPAFVNAHISRPTRP